MNRTLDSELYARPTTQFLALVGLSQWNEMQTFTKLTFLLLMINAIALKIYESIDRSKGEKIITGLHYKRHGNENPILTNSITTCVRLNWKRLGKTNTVPLIIIPSSNKTYFLDIDAGYPDSIVWLDIHNYGKPSTILKRLLDPESNSNLIWKLYTWYHICFSYSEQNSQIRFVMVSVLPIVSVLVLIITFKKQALVSGFFT